MSIPEYPFHPLSSSPHAIPLGTVSFEKPSTPCVHFLRVLLGWLVVFVVLGSLMLFVIHLIAEYKDTDNKNHNFYELSMLMVSQPTACDHHAIPAETCNKYYKWATQGWGWIMMGLALEDTWSDWASLWGFFRWCDPTDEFCVHRTRTLSADLYSNTSMYIYLIFSILIICALSGFCYQCRRAYPKDKEPSNPPLLYPSTQPYSMPTLAPFQQYQLGPSMYPQLPYPSFPPSLSYTNTPVLRIEDVTTPRQVPVVVGPRRRNGAVKSIVDHELDHIHVSSDDDERRHPPSAIDANGTIALE